jgi:coproporphyrinogen III oxidase
MRHWLFQPANRQNPDPALPMSTIAPEHASGLAPEIHDRRAQAKAWFEALQQRICAELERLEDEAPPELYPEPPGRFDSRPWTRETGEGGGLGAFLTGRLFEKAAVHTSAAMTRFSAEWRRPCPAPERSNLRLRQPQPDRASTSPRVPTVHMNTRSSRLRKAVGGGADLTPLIAEQRARSRRRGAVPRGDAGACDPV